jgi:YidC/Oxa1 family membrane protein insertase
VCGYPLNAWSIKSTSKMQEIAPQVSAIQEKNKKDPKRAQMEIVALYKAKGVNPFSGCLPLLIQLPFLIGMFDLLKSTFELRGAPFIPHWIDNLTAPDIVFCWGSPILLGSFSICCQSYRLSDVRQQNSALRYQR